jgi:hypothetical protein
MSYRFKKVYRGYDIGHEVPKDYTPGIIDALLQRGIVELIRTIEPKSVEYTPNKSMKGKRIKNKGAK